MLPGATVRGLHAIRAPCYHGGSTPPLEQCRMKKILLLIVACAFPFAAWAQDPCSLIRPQTLAPAHLFRELRDGSGVFEVPSGSDPVHRPHRVAVRQHGRPPAR